jgi:hypothetical protein
MILRSTMIVTVLNSGPSLRVESPRGSIPPRHVKQLVTVPVAGFSRLYVESGDTIETPP